MAFLDNDTMFFTEKCDGLSVATKDGVNKLYGSRCSEYTYWFFWRHGWLCNDWSEHDQY
jgi:hypothetical protein